MKSIWIINHYAEVPPYGKYTRHFMFAKKLIKLGYSVNIFTASTVHNTNVNYIEDKKKVFCKNIENVPIQFIKSRDYYGNTGSRIGNIFDYFFGVLSATKHLKAPDIVYASSPHPLNWIAAYVIAKRNNAKLICETRDLWPETFVSMGKIKKYNPIALFLYAIEKFIYKKSHALIFTFEGGNDYLAKRKIQRERVYYINNGIELDDFNKQSKEYVYSDPDLETDDTFKVVYTGAMGQANQVKTILEAAKILCAIRNDIQFYLFGDGYEKQELMEYVKDNELTNVFFKGKVEKKFVPSILIRADLLIVTGKDLPIYQYGTSLNKIPEYLASGRPTISNLKTKYDVLLSKQAGVVVPPSDPEKLAQGILDIARMSSIRYDAMCNNALETAQLYDFDFLTEKLERSFE